MPEAKPISPGETTSPPHPLTGELLLDRILEIDSVGIVFFDLRGEITRTNAAFLRMSGYTEADVREHRLWWDRMTPPEWMEASEQHLAQVVAGGSSVPYEKQYFRKDGSRFWGLFASKRIGEHEAVKFIVDISERKATEASLQKAREQLAATGWQLQTVMDSLPALVAYVDAELCYVRTNRAYLEWFGGGRSTIVGLSVLEVVGGPLYAEIKGHLESAVAGHTQQFETAVPSASGERTLSVAQVPDLDSDGAVRGVVIQAHDITERKATEKLLRTAEKLAAVGRLAASMAHEINNPLESVTNLLYLARVSDEPGTVRQYLDQADLELRRVSAITNQTLRFHKQASRPLPLRAEELFESVLTIYGGRLANASVQVEQRIRKVRPVLCFDGEIRQVLSNLVSNALDAMSGRRGSEARLLLRAAEMMDPSTGRQGLRLTLADTGTGMTAATLARIWEPFFTTKEIGGTGLGLWISRDIANRHGGSLRVRSRSREKEAPQAGGGTVFALWLPFEAVVR